MATRLNTLRAVGVTRVDGQPALARGAVLGFSVARRCTQGVALAEG